MIETIIHEIEDRIMAFEAENEAEGEPIQKLMAGCQASALIDLLAWIHALQNTSCRNESCHYLNH